MLAAADHVDNLLFQHRTLPAVWCTQSLSVTVVARAAKNMSQYWPNIFLAHIPGLTKLYAVKGCSCSGSRSSFKRAQLHIGHAWATCPHLQQLHCCVYTAALVDTIQ